MAFIDLKEGNYSTKQRRSWPRILITGGTGQIGRELKQVLFPVGKLLCYDRTQLDLLDVGNLPRLLESLQPDVIVNAAAYTAVDRAEQEEATAYAVNATAPAHLAQWAAAHDVLLIHYSTDYVFDGVKISPYNEDDVPNPLSAYGRSKWEGEKAIRYWATKHLILRTSWVYSPYGRNFLKTILQLGLGQTPLAVVTDQRGTPTPARFIADTTARLIAKYCQTGNRFPFGTYHLASLGQTTWHEYARHILTSALEAGLPLRQDPSEIRPIRTEDYPLPAKRPANSVFDCTKLCSTFDLQLPPWEREIAHTIKQLNDSQHFLSGKTIPSDRHFILKRGS
ncbi:dTDP-4-dehydrorhamnose reductase [Gulbenkiania mobilis]|uniref:dTDP-4-dehydrorhamnose reductase n=1 Tax=Gulbenkiania mobilis TaxID=397457 RepID=UPI0009F84E94|nr:dTDP-4-dehydrorhamnose reductase [Gulbenkiania mobilis]